MLEQEREFLNLLQGIRNRSEEAARTFVDKYGPAVLRIIRRRLMPSLRRQFDSLDFLQDVYASFLCKPPQPEAFDSFDAFFRYLTKMAHRKVIDALRHERGRKFDRDRVLSLDGSAYVASVKIAASDPSPSAVARATDALRDLPPAHQDVLDMLRAGHSLPEIVARLGLHPKWVQRITRSLKDKVLS
jgi:RNA polymerase sigma-70 factor (ECF subfamily)